jgi:AraC-like DNA-binding protein
MINRQRERPGSLLQHPLIWDPLLESLIHGFLLVADHPYRDALDARVEPARPAAVRDAMEIIDTCPQMPLPTTTLAMQCHVSVRTLQEGFRRHLGMSPMAYLRTARLRHAHRDPAALGESLSCHRRLNRAPLGIQPPRPVRRRAQGDVRRNTAASPAVCALNSANPKALRPWMCTPGFAHSREIGLRAAQFVGSPPLGCS